MNTLSVDEMIFLNRTKMAIVGSTTRHLSASVVSARIADNGTKEKINGKVANIGFLVRLSHASNSKSRRNWLQTCEKNNVSVKKLDEQTLEYEIKGNIRAVYFALNSDIVETFSDIINVSVPRPLTTDRRDVNANCPGDKTKSHKMALQYKRASFAGRSKLDRLDATTRSELDKISGKSESENNFREYLRTVKKCKEKGINPPSNSGRFRDIVDALDLVQSLEIILDYIL